VAEGVTKAAKKKEPRAKAPARGAAPLCRIVSMDTQTDRWRPRTGWVPETDALHKLAQFLRDRGEDAYVVSQGEKAAPSHTPAHGAKAGQRVYRFKFPDGDTIDVDPLEFELSKVRQLEKLEFARSISSAALAHADYERRAQSQADGELGGRPSKNKGYDHERLRSMYLEHRADGDHHEARTRLIAELRKLTGAGERTVRDWLIDAGIGGSKRSRN
jgi:hypothetical protein